MRFEYEQPLTDGSLASGVHVEAGHNCGCFKIEAVLKEKGLFGRGDIEKGESMTGAVIGWGRNEDDYVRCRSRHLENVQPHDKAGNRQTTLLKLSQPTFKSSQQI
jgi:hypothetical protein